MNRFESITGGKIDKTKSPLMWFMALMLAFFVAGCGGGDQGRGPILGLPAVNLVSVAVTSVPSPASVPVLGIQQFTALATFSDGTTRDVTTLSNWTSGTPGIATVVSNTGLATGVTAGVAVITASFGGQTGTADLTVTAATLSSIAVTSVPSPASVPIRGIQQFTATATYSDGSTRDVTLSSNWTSGTIGVATVVPTTGVAAGVTAGVSVITASFGGKTATANLTVTASTLTGIAVTPAAFIMPIAGTKPFMATATYSDGSTRDVTLFSSWTSGTVGVATVVPTTGVATGVTAGVSVITASFGGKTATANLTVTASTLTGIAVTPAAFTIPIAGTKPFKATATYGDGSTLDVTASSSWTSGTTGVATVLLNTGVATGVAAGTSVITATYGGKTAIANLTVTASTLTGIAVTPLVSTRPIAGTEPFTATATYSDGSTLDVTTSSRWTSGTTSVATVLLNTGVATGVAAGTSVITATYTAGGITRSGTATLTVSPASIILSTITVTPSAPSIAIGGTQPFVATGNYSDGSSANISSTVAWTSGNTPVATVLSTTGVATGVSAGTATITATLGGKSGSANLTVTAAAGPKGPAAVNLGTAANFVILAKTGISTTGTTAVVGNIGVSPAAATFITGFGLIADPSNVFSTSSYVTGKVYAANYAVPTPANMTTAISDMHTALVDAAGRATPDFTELGAGNISGLTLVPGLYKWGTGVLITGAGVTLSGGSNDVWIFQIAKDLTVNNGAIITLSGGAQAKNVFWQVGGLPGAALGTGVNFSGNILSAYAITLNTGATMTGRALADSAVTLNATHITTP